jgi:hypothetical protein
LTFTSDALAPGKPLAAAVSGTAAQLMGVYSSALEVIQPLAGGAGAPADAIAAAVVRAAYALLNATDAEAGGGRSALSSAAKVAKLYGHAYEDSRRRSQAAVRGRTAAELQPLFESVGKVGGRASLRKGRVEVAAQALIGGAPDERTHLENAAEPPPPTDSLC